MAYGPNEISREKNNKERCFLERKMVSTKSHRKTNVESLIEHNSKNEVKIGKINFGKKYSIVLQKYQE